tara:strand:- start:298 stop:555 length:258 start_codon:yes stop_codon:yes gene_type:complete
MKISLEFEKRLIELFGSEHDVEKKTFEKILEPELRKENYNKIVNKPRENKKNTEESRNLPSGFTLFMGIGIGIGLASHAVLTKTD